VANRQTCFGGRGVPGHAALGAERYGPRSRPASDLVQLQGTHGNNGWWVSSVTVAWTVSGTGLISVNGCGTTQIQGDHVGAKVKCEATFDDGTGATTISKSTVPIDIDVTAPDVSGSPARQPDSAGWYNQPVVVSFSGTDATSGVDDSSCSIKSYSGPDDATAHVSGSCADNAGNPGSANFGVKYDSTAPGVRATPARKPYRYGWYNRDIRINFKGSDAVSGVAHCTHSVYRGPTDATASATGGCTDVAGNTRGRALIFKFAKPFLTPRSGSRVSGPPKPDWPAVARAKYYNFQLWHDGKVLSRWPQKSSIELRWHWSFAGRRHHLEPGRYDWYVWPRYHGRNHDLLGHGVFYVRAS
jgi:hypothetical protein